MFSRIFIILSKWFSKPKVQTAEEYWKERKEKNSSTVLYIEEVLIK